MGLLALYKKHGGAALLKRYIRTGTLGTAGAQFVLLGKSRTAMEILRLSVQMKTKKRLRRKYQKTLEAFERDYDASLPHEASKRVWTCWFQGMENAPEIVQNCHRSLKEHIRDREIVLITAENLNDYVQIPDYIVEKWKKGIITHTHFSDIVRLELLIRYGGVWLDASVFMSGDASLVPDFVFDADLFFFQNLKPGRDGHAIYLSSWLMSAKTNQKILMGARALLYEYWRKNDSMDDYLLLHQFISILLDRWPEEWEKIVPMGNEAPHMLYFKLFEPYDERLWNALRAQTVFHKLNYRFDPAQAEKEGTFYKEVVLK